MATPVLSPRPPPKSFIHITHLLVHSSLFIISQTILSFDHLTSRRPQLIAARALTKVKYRAQRSYSLTEVKSPQQIQSLLLTESLDRICTDSSRSCCHASHEMSKSMSQAQARRVNNVLFVFKSRYLDKFANVK